MSKIQMMVCAASAFFLISCSGPDSAPVKINDVRVSEQEFDRLYRLSYKEKSSEGADSRRAFLEELISRKLMLLEAERLGLDRDPGFLKDVQDFWQERLLMSVLRLKAEEYKQQVQVTDDQIRAYYEQHSESFREKDWQRNADSIRLLLIGTAQQQMMEEWLKSLHDRADIKIDYSQLGIQPQ